MTLSISLEELNELVRQSPPSLAVFARDTVCNDLLVQMEHGLTNYYSEEELEEFIRSCKLREAQ